MAKRRNPFRPGSVRCAQLRRAELARRAALVRATAARTKRPEARQRANKKAAAAERGIKGIAARQDFRSRLKPDDREVFNSVSLGQQDRLLTMQRDHPYGSVPSDLPDPFAGKNRNMLCRLYYSSRAGSRLRRIA